MINIIIPFFRGSEKGFPAFFTFPRADFYGILQNIFRFLSKSCFFAGTEENF